MISASGRFDRPLRARLKVTRQQRRQAAMIVRTEQGALSLFRTTAWGVLRKAGRFAKGDCSIEHKRKVWRRLNGYAVRLSTVKYLGGKKQCWAIVGVYRLRRNHNLRAVIGVHMPARVESALHHGIKTVDTEAWLQSLEKLGDIVADLKKEYPGAEIIVVGDWNVSLRAPKFRTVITNALDLVPATPADGLGNPISWAEVRGTHGSRPIDGAFTNRESIFTVLSDNEASDHRPILVR